MNTITEKLSGYRTEDHSNPRGEVCVSAWNGSRLANIAEHADGSFSVTLFIDYGVDGLNWCDSATYKTASGALRKAKGYLR